MNGHSNFDLVSPYVLPKLFPSFTVSYCSYTHIAVMILSYFLGVEIVLWHQSH